MSGLLSALLGTSSVAATQVAPVAPAPVVDEPTIVSSDAAPAQSNVAQETTPAASSDDVPAAATSQPDQGAAASTQDNKPADQDAPVVTGSMVVIGPNGTRTIEKSFTNFADFEKFLMASLGGDIEDVEDEDTTGPAAQDASTQDASAQDAPAQEKKQSSGIPESIRKLLLSSRETCGCPKCATWRKERTVASGSAQDAADQEEKSTPPPQNAAEDLNDPKNINDKSDTKLSKLDGLDLLLSLLGGSNRNVVPGKPETYTRLPAVGDAAARDTFIPLTVSGVSANNPKAPDGMSSAFYARQYCDVFSDDTADAKLDMPQWIALDHLNDMIRTAASKPVTSPEARVHVLSGTYFRHRTTRQNVLASVFLRKLQRWLGEHYGADVTWKRVVVFDDDCMGYTVCY